MWGAVIFARYGSGEIQQWENPDQGEEKRVDSLDISKM